MVSVIIVTIIALIASVLTEASSSCNTQEKMDYIRNNFEPECRHAISLILVEKDPQLNGVDFDLACTSSCLGRYSSWLLSECNNTNAAHLAQIACLESTDATTHQVSRCRKFFPDVANELVFVDTSPCGAFLSMERVNWVNCVTGCGVPLNTLIDTIGCCFQSIYNDSCVIASLAEEGFLGQSQRSVLTLFGMSDLLDTCRTGTIPEVCPGDPFPVVSVVSGTESGDVTTAAVDATVPGDDNTVVNSADISSSSITITQLVPVLIISYLN